MLKSLAQISKALKVLMKETADQKSQMENLKTVLSSLEQDYSSLKERVSELGISSEKQCPAMSDHESRDGCGESSEDLEQAEVPSDSEKRDPNTTLYNETENAQK